jgi:uncharacterized surface anchored protein
VLPEQVSGQAPAPQAVTQRPEGRQEVLGEQESGNAPQATTPSAAQQARPASSNRALPFTGTDAAAVLLTGVLMLVAGLALRHFIAQRA